MKPEARIGYANIFGGLEALRALYMNGYALEDDLRTLETPGILNDVSRDRLESDIAHLRGAVLAEQGASSAFAHQVRAMGIELAEQQKVQLAKDRKAPCIMPDEAAAS